MTRRSLALTIIAILGVLIATGASAKPGKQGQRFMAKPFEFVGAAGACGAGSPAGEDTVVAAWVTHEGLPDAGKSDHALLLSKSGETENCAAAGANLWWV